MIIIGSLVNARLKRRLLGAKLPAPHMGNEGFGAASLWQVFRSKRPLLADFGLSQRSALGRLQPVVTTV